MSEKIMTVLSGCCVPVIMWLLVSWFDVVVNSVGGSVHAWNLFMLLAH